MSKQAPTSGDPGRWTWARPARVSSPAALTEAAPSYVGRRVADVAIALYASPSYLERISPRADLETHEWIGLDESLARTTIARWMTRSVPQERVMLRTDSVAALCHAAMGGLGVAPLPCYMVDSAKGGLRRIRSAPIEEMTTQLWILTHEDLKRTARVRAFTEWAFVELSKHADLLEGRRTAGAKKAAATSS